MAKRSRTYNSSLNLLSSFGKQMITLLLGFVSRWFFIKILGASYLGINGLFANIISVLSMADLGFGSAIVYSMYKPLAENDERKLAALLQFYKRVYRVIALVISVIGFSLIPFLKYLVKLDTPIENIEIYYILFLVNVIISYLYSYKMCIITADQKDYLLNIYSFVFTIIQFVLQLVVLFTLKNYIVYLIVQILCSFANNVFSSRKAVQRYPFINNKEKLSSIEKQEISKNIKAMFLYKIGGVLLNNTDNILISTLVGTITVGFYSNYSMIVQSIDTFARMFFSSINAGIGNLSVSEDIEYQFKIYKIVDFVAYMIYGFCTVCLFILMGDFVELCYGQEYRLETIICALIVINFYIPGSISANSVYRNATGMFKQMKYLLIVTSFINLVLSVILGIKYGLFGIFLATGVSRLLTNVWYEPMILYKKYFHRRISDYIITHLSRDVILIFVLVIVNFVCKICRPLSIVSFLVKAVICGTTTLLLLIIIYWRTEEFEVLRTRIKGEIVKK